MAKEDGFIKISRSIDDWEHSDSLAMIGFWVRLLLLANWDSSKKNVKRGELVITMPILAAICNVSEKTVRRNLKKLVESGEIKISTNHRKTRIQIINYEKYQTGKFYRENNEPGKNDRTNDRTADQTNDRTADQTHPYIKKDIKNLRNEEVEEGKTGFTPPTPTQVKEYADSIGFNLDPEYFIDYYSECGWIKKNGQPITDWKATIRNWQRKDKKTEETKKQNEINDGNSGKPKPDYGFSKDIPWLDE